MIPTFIGITLFSFLIINMAPGGPIEQKLQAMRFGGASREGGEKMGNVGMNAEVMEALNKQYGFDKPIQERYYIWLRNIVKLDFGNSFTFEDPVIDVISSRFPVSLQFGIVSFILSYLVCIPLGVMKAIKANTAFDHISGIILYAAYSVPVLVLGIFLITFFAGGSYFNWFPIGMLYSDNYESLTTWGKILDRLHHFILPIICYMLGGFTELTMLMRNSMLDVVKSDYVRTARAKGLSENVVLFKHALRNAFLPIATGIGGFFRVFLAGSLIIENVFQLNGIGQLSYSSILARDYNVIMGILFLSAVFLMLGRVFSDIVYVLVDPRIDFK